MVASRRVFGRITLLEKLRPASSHVDHLVVGTDMQMFFTLSWDAENKLLRTEQTYHDMADDTGRLAQYPERCCIDPAGEFLILEVYEATITTIPMARKGKKKGEFEPGVLGEPIVSRIPDFVVPSSAFLYGRKPGEKPRLAMLCKDYKGEIKLKVRELQYDAVNGDVVEWIDVTRETIELDLGASHLIPLSDPPYGALILGETRISYWNERNRDLIIQPVQPTIFVNWEKIDNQRYVLADDFGKLYLLMIELNFEDKVEGWKLDVLGKTSRANTLVYLDAGRIYLGSHSGDSQVIQISEQSIEVVQSFSNLAPILDFHIMDMGNRSGEGQINEFSSGQARLITASGAWSDGSLRSVRSGVGLEDLGQLEGMEGIMNIFSLKTDPSSPYDDILLACFASDSRVIYCGPDGSFEELEDFKGLLLSEQTLLAKNMTGAQLLQVTSSTVAMIDLESSMLNSQWEPNGTITAVAASENHVLICVNGTELVVLDINKDLSMVAQKTFDTSQQLSCVELSSSLPSICVIGFWQGSSISVLELATLSVLQTFIISSDSLAAPRSLLIAPLFTDKTPTLLVGMADGNVVTFTISTQSPSAPLSQKQSTLLGTQEPSFAPLPRSNDTVGVFTTIEHPTLIHASEGRIVYSAISASTASSVCSFNAAAYPGAVAMATESGLRISLIDTERTTHVQTLKVGETVRRFAHSPALKCFGLGCIRKDVVDNEEIIKSSFKLADEVGFEEVDSHPLEENEIVDSVIRAELDDGTGEKAERFIVGTANLIGTEGVNEQVKGRLFIFEVTADRKLKVVYKNEYNGAVKCLAMLDDGKIVAGLSKVVAICSLEYQSIGSPKLVKRCTFKMATFPADLSVVGNRIAVADVMKSAFVLEYKPGRTGAGGDDPDKLVVLARHPQTSWAISIAEITPTTWLEGDSEGNLLVLNQDLAGVTQDDRETLRLTSEMHLGEMVNRIRVIDVKAQPNSAVQPRAFMGTVSFLSRVPGNGRSLTFCRF